MKLENDDEYFIENRKYNASVMYHIVDSIINNESKTHKDIIKDLGGTKYSEPCYIKLFKLKIYRSNFYFRFCFLNVLSIKLSSI